jgi:hypothetical protein
MISLRFNISSRKNIRNVIFLSVISKQNLLIILALAFYGMQAYSQSNNLRVLEQAQPNAFILAAGDKVSPLIIDVADEKVVKIAAGILAGDIKAVTSKEPILLNNIPAGSYPVIIGTLGKSKWIDDLAARALIPVRGIKGKWETFSISLVNNPSKGIKSALVIAGSDPRGTAFGVFELSKIIGVSPWIWWADAAPQHRSELYLSGKQSIVGPPSVKYRGIFINDEDWGLQPWAAKTFEPSTGDIGPKTYAKVFELLLRLKANLLWPAMHPGTKPFFYYPGNKQVAADYAIVIGSSHAEPMLRNNVGEWDKKTMGDFNYLTNKQTILDYWEQRVKETNDIDAVYSLGMRGIHDSGMEGVKDPGDAVPLIERIFSDQRGLLEKYRKKNIDSIPQVFTAYKEVLDIYDNGLKVPQDVTLVWPDDNYGYIQRLSNGQEEKRTGGAGIYYHASYWGRPHDYLWLGTAHPGLIREEMMKAFAMKADRLWVLNAGDIKPLEYTIEFFMDMAFNATPFKDSRYTQQHLLQWAAGLFGKQNAGAIREIMWKYYQLAFERKPEFMGWSQTEPTTQTQYTAYNHFFYSDQAQQRLFRYDSLQQAVARLQQNIAIKDCSAFYQLVTYPVTGASLLNKKFLYRDKASIFGRQHRLSANEYAERSNKAYDDIRSVTAYYNTELASGKWSQIMSMKPRDLPVFQAPVIEKSLEDPSAVWGIAPEGMDTGTLSTTVPLMQLPAFDNLNRQRYFVDIFLSAAVDVDWKAIVSSRWIRLSATSGHLAPVTGSSELRVWIEIDWKKVPADKCFSGEIIFEGAGKRKVVTISANNFSAAGISRGSFIEKNGVVSMYAANYTKSISRRSGQWNRLEDLGYTGRSVQSSLRKAEQPSLDTQSVSSLNSHLTYDFYSFTAAVPVVNVFCLPTHPYNKNYSMRYAVSIDGGPVTIVDLRTWGRSEEWKQNVLSNSSVKKITLPLIQADHHVLKIFCIDPGVILDRIVIDLGGLKKGYGVIPETILAD